MSWPYEREAILHDPKADRPIFQGDIFLHVPIIKARAGDSPPESDPKISVDRRPAMVLGYPCDIYDHGRLLRVQSLAVLREATKLGIPDDWSGGYSACPIPDPFGDGELWGVDFLTTSPVDRAYLTPDNRVASLTEVGFAHLRQRQILASTRQRVKIEAIQAGGRELWNEIELWQLWVELGRAPHEFEAWLDGHDARLGTVRRTLLRDERLEELRSALREMAA